jgi:hypothetical protein
MIPILSFSLSLSLSHTDIHTYTHTYGYNGPCSCADTGLLNSLYLDAPNWKNLLALITSVSQLTPFSARSIKRPRKVVKCDMALHNYLRSYRSKYSAVCLRLSFLLEQREDAGEMQVFNLRFY